MKRIVFLFMVVMLLPGCARKSESSSEAVNTVRIQHIQYVIEGDSSDFYTFDNADPQWALRDPEGRRVPLQNIPGLSWQGAAQRFTIEKTPAALDGWEACCYDGNAPGKNPLQTILLRVIPAPGEITLQLPGINADIRLIPIDRQETEDPLLQQAVVDMENTAAWLTDPTWMVEAVVADHNFQGFEAIKAFRQGTEICVRRDGGSEIWACVRVDANGSNRNDSIFDSSGVNAATAEENRGRLMLYTCNDTWEEVTIALFERKEQPPVSSGFPAAN